MSKILSKRTGQSPEPAVLHFSQRRCSQATCFHQEPLMFVSTEDLQLQLTGRTKHSAAFGILLPLRCRQGAAQSQDTTYNLMGNTQHRWESAESSRQLPLKNHSLNTSLSLQITNSHRGLRAAQLGGWNKIIFKVISNPSHSVIP